MTELGSIVFSGLSWLLVPVALTAAVAVALVWSARGGTASRQVRMGCGLLKLTGVLLLALCLLDPLWVSQKARPGANIFGILADNSQSLQLKDGNATESRSELLKKTLKPADGEWQTKLAENFQIRRYIFDSRLQNSRDFSDLTFDGRSSAIITSLKTATEHWHGQPVAGLLLFTDGNATDLGSDLPSFQGLPPVYPVVMGKESEITDLALRKVAVSQTAFEDAPVTVQAEVSATGYSGAEVVARLTEIGTGISSGQANASGVVAFKISASTNAVVQLIQRAKSADANLNFRFQLQPETPGIHFYELETRSRSELAPTTNASAEATLVNNKQMVVVDRGQEPFRVLYVGGRPTWEFKFLNRAIMEDTQVKMVSLIRIAKREAKFEFKGRVGESNNPLYRGFDQKNKEGEVGYDKPVTIALNTRDADELSGGFPKTAEELYKYHAIIIGATEAEFFSRDQMTLIQRFVSERGGGFLMLGSADSFREGNYAGTPVASMLPVYLDKGTDAKLPGQMKLALTREGWLQPWTRLRGTESEENSRLEEMPKFEIFNPVTNIKPGSSVLASVTDLEDKTFPALVVQRFGLGRSAALLVGDMWRWGLRDEAMQKDLGKSWRQMVRWLVSDVPSRIMVSAEPSLSGDSSEIRLTVKARDAEYKPIENATVSLKVTPVRLLNEAPQKKPGALKSQKSDQLTADPAASGTGTYEATYIARDPGAYTVEAVVTHADGKMAGQATSGWASDPASAEFRSLKPNRTLLETIAKKTGGQVIALADLDAFVRRLPEKKAPVTEAVTDPLWHKPIVFLLVLACFVAEWGIRRWKGLL